jgi:AcrR family transcriptional regulator
MDHTRVARELVRVLRGKRSQVALSRWLGFRTNVVYTWECGRSEPSLLQLFQVAAKSSVDPRKALRRFYRQPPPWLAGTGPLSSREVAAMLEHERGGLSVLQVARESGVSRFSLARYLQGAADIRLADFLRVLETCSRRALDFLALWVDVEQLPAAADSWRRQSLARRAAYERPWSHAVLRCLELFNGEDSAPSAAMLAESLGIDEGEVKDCLSLLEQSGQILREKARWVFDPSHAVELGADRQAAQQLAAWWVSVAAERARQQPGMFAYNLCAVSAEDLKRIAALERDCLRQVRAIVAHSKPAERVALIAVQVLGLDGKVAREAGASG